MSGLESSDRMATQVERATKRLAQLRARQSLREMRLATREKERARRAAVRRQMELGGVALNAGYGDLDPAAFAGLLKNLRATGREFRDARPIE